MDIEKEAIEACEWLKQLIAIPSYSKEEDTAALCVEQHLTERGYSPRRKGNNVWCLSPNFDASKPTLLLNSHIDTVRPVAGWTMNPLTPVEQNECIYGLGSNDAGASLVSLFSVFQYLSTSEQPYNVIFLASAEEEISGANGIETVLPELPPIALGVVGEPTGMRVAIAEKGLLVIDCYASGKAGHAALCSGDNAIYKAMESIEQVKNFIFPRMSHLLGGVKMTVTMINAGTQHNVIPDFCSFVIDVRTNELYTNKEIVDMLRQYLACEIKPRSLRLNSSRVDANHPILSRARKLELELFGSPTLSDQALMSFSTIKIGPGSSERSHAADEYIDRADIKQAIEVYIKLLDGLKL